jgi:hypothetical protein
MHLVSGDRPDESVVIGVGAWTPGPRLSLGNPGHNRPQERAPWLFRTRNATCTTNDVSAGNIGVVREESGPTDTDCARGLLPTRDLSQGAVAMHRFPRQDCSVPPGD